MLHILSRSWAVLREVSLGVERPLMGGEELAKDRAVREVGIDALLRSCVRFRASMLLLVTRLSNCSARSSVDSFSSWIILKENKAFHWVLLLLNVPSLWVPLASLFILLWRNIFQGSGHMTDLRTVHSYQQNLPPPSYFTIIYLFHYLFNYNYLHSFPKKFFKARQLGLQHESKEWKLLRCSSAFHCRLKVKPWLSHQVSFVSDSSLISSQFHLWQGEGFPLIYIVPISSPRDCGQSEEMLLSCIRTSAVTTRVTSLQHACITLRQLVCISCLHPLPKSCPFPPPPGCLGLLREYYNCVLLHPLCITETTIFCLYSSLTFLEG